MTTCPFCHGTTASCMCATAPLRKSPLATDHRPTIALPKPVGPCGSQACRLGCYLEEVNGETCQEQRLADLLGPPHNYVRGEPEKRRVPKYLQRKPDADAAFLRSLAAEQEARAGTPLDLVARLRRIADRLEEF